MKTFTLNNGHTFMKKDNGYCYAIVNNTKTRISLPVFNANYEQFVKEENERQNAKNLFTNIDVKEQFMAEFDAAAENDGVTLEEFCQLVQEAEPVKLEDPHCRHPEGTDLQVPAVIDPQYGCVDCSKCNVQNCVHRNCMRRNPISYGGLAECPRLKVKAEQPEVKKTTKRPKRVSKDIAYSYVERDETNNITLEVTLTTKQVDFIKHLPDTCFWENGLDSTIWVDCLCDDIQGQFAGKPMTVGAMISTLCEKGLGTRATCRREKRKCTSFELTELGKLVAAEVGLQ